MSLSDQLFLFHFESTLLRCVLFTQIYTEWTRQVNFELWKWPGNLAIKLQNFILIFSRIEKLLWVKNLCLVIYPFWGTLTPKKWLLQWCLSVIWVLLYMLQHKHFNWFQSNVSCGRIFTISWDSLFFFFTTRHFWVTALSKTNIKLPCY